MYVRRETPGGKALPLAARLSVIMLCTIPLVSHGDRVPPSASVSGIRQRLDFSSTMPDADGGGETPTTSPNPRTGYLHPARPKGDATKSGVDIPAAEDAAPSRFLATVSGGFASRKAGNREASPSQNSASVAPGSKRPAENAFDDDDAFHISTDVVTPLVADLKSGKGALLAPTHVKRAKVLVWDEHGISAAETVQQLLAAGLPPTNVYCLASKYDQFQLEALKCRR